MQGTRRAPYWRTPSVDRLKTLMMLVTCYTSMQRSRAHDTNVHEFASHINTRSTNKHRRGIGRSKPSRDLRDQSQIPLRYRASEPARKLVR